MEARTGRRLRRALVAFAVLCAGTLLALRTERAGALVCEALRAEVPRITGREVVIGSCRILPFELAVQLTGVKVSEQGAAAPLVEAELAQVGLRSVLPGRVALSSVVLDRPRVQLDLSKLEAGPPGQGCPLEGLKRLKIDRLEVKEAQVALALPDDAAVRLDGLGVDWEVRRGVIEASLALRGGQVQALGRTAALGQTRVEGELDVDDERATLRRVEVQVEGATASVSGDVDALCDVPRLALSAQVFLPLDLIPRFTGKLPRAGGAVWARVSATGRVDAPSVRAEVQATGVTLPPAKPGDFSARVAWQGRELVLEDFQAKVGKEGTVRVSGQLTLDGDFPVKAKVETHDASLARVLEKAGVPGAWVDFPATVKGSVSGHLKPGPELGGDFEAKVGRFQLATRAWDAPANQGLDVLTFPQGRTTFHFSVHPDRVHFANARVHVGRTDATDVTGDVILYFDMAKGLDIRADAHHLALSDFGHIATLPWMGSGTASVNVKGPYSDPQIEGHASLRDFHFARYALGVLQTPLKFRGDTLTFGGVLGQKGRTLYAGRLQLDFVDHGPRVLSDVVVLHGRTEDLVDVIAGLHPNVATLQGPLVGDVVATSHVDSLVSQLNGVIRLHLKDTRYYGRGLGAGTATLRFDRGEALVLEPLKLQGPLGTTTAAGRWNWDGPLDFRLAIDGGSLSDLWADTGGDVSGAFSMKATLSGSTDTPVLEGWLASNEVLLRQKSLGPSHLELRLQGRDADIFGTPFTGVRGKVKLLVKDDWPLQGTLAVDLPDLRPFLPDGLAKQGLSGAVAGRLTVGGHFARTRGLVVDAALGKVQLQRGDFAVRNDGPVELAWRNGGVALQKLSVRGPNTELQAEGTWGPEQVDLKTRGTLDLRLVETFWTQLERTGGRLELAASVTGPVANPEVAGTAAVTDARFLVKGWQAQVRSLMGRADFSQSRVLLSGFQGFLNDGRVRGRGDVELKDLSLARLEANVDLEDVTMTFWPDLPSTLTGSVLFYGKPDAWQLAGAVDVVRFRYDKPMALEALQRDVRERRYASSDARPHEWVKYDVDVSLGGDVRVDNNLARARLAGKVKLTGTNVKPVLLGTVESQEGSQAFFRGNQLNIQRGVLSFNGTGLEPTFDLAAWTQLREYLVNLKAFGRVDDPRVSYTSEPALSEADVLSLLTLGITSHDRVSSQAGAGLAAEALLSASGLNRQVQRFFSKSEVLKDQRVNLSTSFNEATGQAEPSLSWESKVLTDNLKVGVTQPVTGRGTKAQAEYKFNQRVSARVQWDNQSQESSVGNPGVDLKFRFEWE